MALIRSTSLTRSYARICIRGVCVLSVNEVVETWKVPSDADKCRSCRTPRIRRQKNGGDWSLLTILVSKVSISSVQHFTERSDWDAVTVVLGAASVGGLFHVRLGNASRRPPGHRIVFYMPAFIDLSGDAAIIDNINLALYDLPQ